jgi:hypothetical protein
MNVPNGGHSPPCQGRKKMVRHDAHYEEWIPACAGMTGNTTEKEDKTKLKCENKIEEY